MDNVETQQYNGEDVAATLTAVAPGMPVMIDLVEEESAELPAGADGTAMQKPQPPSKPYNPNSREAKLKKYLAEAILFMHACLS